MKKTFKIFCYIFAVVVCWAILFKLLHWPGGNMMCLIAAVLGIIASILGLCAYLKDNQSGKGLVIFTALTVALSCIGLWFKVSHIPGANILSLICFGLFMPVAIIWNIAKCNK